jgi:hypothetical protein
VHPSAPMRPTTSDQATLLRWALALPHILLLRTLPPCLRGLQCCHTSHGSGPHPTSEMGSNIITWHMAPDLITPYKRAAVLARVPWHFVSHENKGRLSYNGRVG